MPTHDKTSIRKTEWFIQFKKDVSAHPDVLWEVHMSNTAIEFATNPDERFIIQLTNESGTPGFAIVPNSDQGFWMDLKPTKEEAIKLCEEMGWNYSCADNI